MSLSVERRTLEFSSGHDLVVCEFKPRLSSVLMVRTLLGILSLLLSALLLVLSLSQNK